MGSRSDNGGDWPSEGGSPDGLPDFPEEWGIIVIPDDLSELADEVEAIRAELGRTGPRTRWQRITARPALRGLRRILAAGVKAPVLIVSMAILVTVASLFASAWPAPPRSPATQRTANTTDEPTDLPALEMEGAGAQPVALRGQLPAVVLITDGCECAQLVADTVTAVRPSTKVLVVTSGLQPTSRRTPPTGATPQAQGKTVWVLRDPASGLRDSLHLGPGTGGATVLLVDHSAHILRMVREARSVEAFRADLARL